MKGLESSRHDTDDAMRLRVEINDASEHGAIAAEMLDPQPMTENRDVPFPAVGLVGPKRAAKLRLHTECLEEVRGDAGAVQLSRLTGASHGDSPSRAERGN